MARCCKLRKAGDGRYRIGSACRTHDCVEACFCKIFGACCPSKLECQVPVGFFCLLAQLSNKIGAVIIEVELDPGGAGGEEFSSKSIFGVDELYVVATTCSD